MTTRTRIVVADDHHMFRAGVIELLESMPNLEVVAECATGDDAIKLAAEHTPDIVILDIEMPGPGPAAAIRGIIDASPHTKAVVLTMHDAPRLVQEAFAAGAGAYLLKSAGRPELVAAISTVGRREDSVLLSVSRDTLMKINESDASPTSKLLSPRELEVLRLLADAKSNRDIAGELYISDGTVKRHLANIYAKLDATSRIDAVRRAEQLGILGSAPDPWHPVRPRDVVG